MNFILIDIPQVKNNLLPLTYFRPVGELICGITSLKEKWEKLLKSKTSYLTESYLQKKYPVVYQEENIYINSAIFPNPQLIKFIKDLKPEQKLVHKQQIIAFKTTPIDIKDFDKKNFEEIPYPYPIDEIFHLYDIFIKNGQKIKEDFQNLEINKKNNKLSISNTIIGKNPIFTQENVQAEACVFNTTDGPIFLGKNVKILEGSLLRGPLAILDNSIIKMGAKIYGDTTVGVNCKVGGEVKAVVFQGNTNKGHDGYLGDSVIGEWCNLGANTNNSNLKNNYSEVKLWNYPKKQFINTGLQFCGLIMGDHSKAGISTMFNTGTVVGVNANIYGSDFQPKFFPSFQWGNAQKMTAYRFEKAKEVAKAVMERRNKKFEGTEADLFEEVYKKVKKIENI